MKIRFLTRASKGCLALRRGLAEAGHDVLKIKHSGSTYRGYRNHLIVSWGKTNRGIIRDDINILNNPQAVANASNKVKTFELLSEAGLENSLPRWTTQMGEAQRFAGEGEVIYCRTLSSGSQGRGIKLAHSRDEVVSAPLYTCKVEVSREIRVHVFNGEVIHFAQKKRMGSERREEEGITEVNEDIRSHANGWIFSITDVEIPQEAKDVAIEAVRSLGMDFGAVDMALTEQGGCKIYEVNSAPGLEGTTLTKYIEAFSNYARNL